ncbi:hypothetical protein KC19_10G138600 [Ceratodon purpureus]|uniref:WRC domain-containing protein n=1 Tax=Ceratodon purpureus TaxID=3225 RepID=A0A8T0GSI0_CERPU|nr:hypothetical protein KC19_10G138600 [Ceratodon purpureus]
MRIRKHQSRVNVGGESSSGAQRTDPGSQEQSELALSSRGVKEKPNETVQTDSPAEVEEGADEGSGPGVRALVPRGIERVDSTPRSAFTWLDKLRHAKGFTELEPYSNLEDFVSSLTKRDDGRGIAHSEEIVEGGDLNRLVGGVDLKAHHLLQSDASLPNVAERAKDRVDAFTDKSSDASGMPSQGAEVLERLLTKDGKQRREDQLPHKKSSSYWGQARNTSWMLDTLESSEVERSYGESSGKKDFAGTSSKKPLNYEISDVSCQPATGEAVFEQRHVGPGEYSASIAKSVGTRHGALPRIPFIQDPPTETIQRRSSRNRRIPSSTGRTFPLQFTSSSQIADEEQELRPAPPLSPDHPAQQMKDSLAFSLYTVLLRAGKAGLTAREAMSDIMEQRLAGVEEGAVQSSRRIAKLLRNSPYYMEVGEGKFALCTAVIDSEQDIACEESLPDLQEENSQQTSRSGKERPSESSTEDGSKSLAGSEDKAPAIRRKRKRTVREASEAETEVRSKPLRTGRPKKLKYMKQENAENLGNQCNRTDGKGWVCPLLAKPGYQLCDHHLDKLRCKPGSRSKKKKLMKLAADDAEAATTTHEEPHSVDTARHELTTP